MKLSELIEEFVTGLIEGAPKDSEWRSNRQNYEARQQYDERMDELRTEIDRVVALKDGSHGR